jgi:hypothetical protein
MKPTSSLKLSAWSASRSPTWKMAPPQPLTVSRVVVAKPAVSSKVRISAAKDSCAVDTLGTPSSTVPSASKRPRTNAQ